MAIDFTEFEQIAQKNTIKKKQEEENKDIQKEIKQCEEQYEEQLEKLKLFKSYILSEDFENWLALELNDKKQEIKLFGYFSFTVIEHTTCFDATKINPYGLVKTNYSIYTDIATTSELSASFTFLTQCGQNKTPQNHVVYSMVQEILDLIEDRLVEITKNKFIIERKEKTDISGIDTIKYNKYYIRFCYND